MYARRPTGTPPPSFGGFGSGPAPRDLLILLAVVFTTFSLQFFSATKPLIDLLRLTPQAWSSGFVWQLGTYPFAGVGAPSFWFLLELLMIFWFGGDTFRRLGQKNFWMLIAWAVGAAAVVAVGVDIAGTLLFGGASPVAFALLQGQRTLLVIFITAFAVLNRNAVIYLFFILPVKARWFLPLEVVFAFFGYLRTKDMAGFLGLLTAIGLTYSILTPGGARRFTREAWLRLQRRWAQLRLALLRRRRGIRVVKDSEKVKRGPWVN